MLGLGLLGRGINVAKFLAQNGALLTITDLKTKDKLKSSLNELKKYKINYVLGQHRLEDFRNCNMVIKAAGVPLDSPYIEEAHKNNIPVEMDASLFAKLAPRGVIIVGITGTRGKSTVTALITHILETAGERVFIGGNVRGLATLPLLNSVKSGDYVVLELDSWQLQGFREAKISPHVAVFTNLMPDHMNYYKGDMDKYFSDKANIFLFQKTDDFLVAGNSLKEKIKRDASFVGADDLPKNIKLIIEGEHNRSNAALAYEAVKFLGISAEIIKKALEDFTAVEGRLQYIGEKNGVKIYNDNNATTGEATVAALKTLGKNKNIVLIIGGFDKGLNMSILFENINKYCHAVVLLSGTGTEKIKPDIMKIEKLKIYENEKLEECIKIAVKFSKKGDIILFSPAFASYSQYFQNEYERNDLFMKEIKKCLV